MCVWEMLCTIPYGEQRHTAQSPKQIAHDRGISKMSSQAVGNAIGRNPVSVIVPCHRVIGAKGNLTGYAGGIERKAELLKIEQNQNATEQYPFDKVKENVYKDKFFLFLYMGSIIKFMENNNFNIQEELKSFPQDRAYILCMTSGTRSFMSGKRSV